jgi:hypothetical protein
MSLGYTPTELLFYAVRRGDLTAVKELLRRGVDVNARTGGGWTPLHVAAENGRVEIAELLISSGADVNARTKYGSTPLHEAARRGHADVVRLLLERGADPGMVDDYGRTPLDIAREYGYAEVISVIEEHLRKPLSTVRTPGESEVSRAETALLSILSVEASNLYLGEWGRIIVKARGAGKASVKLEGDIDWIDPGRVELSTQPTVEVPVKPRITGEVPVKVTIKAPEGEDSRIVWLKVSERTRRCPRCGAPAEPGAKYCWRCGARLG